MQIATSRAQRQAGAAVQNIIIVQKEDHIFISPPDAEHWLGFLSVSASSSSVRVTIAGRSSCPGSTPGENTGSPYWAVLSDLTLDFNDLLTWTEQGSTHNHFRSHHSAIVWSKDEQPGCYLYQHLFNQLHCKSFVSSCAQWPRTEWCLN